MCIVCGDGEESSSSQNGAQETEMGVLYAKIPCVRQKMSVDVISYVTCINMFIAPTYHVTSINMCYISSVNIFIDVTP